MSTLIGVAVLPSGTETLADKLAPLGVTLPGSPVGGGGVFVAVDGWDTRPAEILAAKISEATGGTVFSVLAQTSADVYVVAEYVAGKLLRQISFNRDDGGWLPPVGVPRSWEADFHFALPVDDFVDRLSDDDDWSDQDLAAARAAHEAHRVEELPRLPAASGSQIHAFVKGLGIDLSEGTTARYKKPGILQKLFGR